MAQRKVILEELEALNSLRDLAQSYEEIAAIRMQQIKDSVLRTRDFLADLSDVFVDLKTSYNREVNDLLSRRKVGNTTLSASLRKRGRELMVYLSSNGKLYGSVTQKTFRLLSQDLSLLEANEKADLLIVGDAGREMYENSGIGRPFEYMEVPDTNVSIDHIKKLVTKFLDYEKVFVYYGKFSNVVTQQPIATSVTGEQVFETEVRETIKREDRFIFEPSLEKIFHFFETQIMSNLLSQTILENQLARHASRVNAMEEALLHIEGEEKKLGVQRTRLKHLTQNRKQLETISGIVLWGD
jgi:ATP synthase F1 gamma subunit